MIYTSTDAEQICGYDRKSPRHNWQMFVSSSSLKHVRKVAKIWRDRAANTPGWEQYQQQIAVMTPVDGALYDNLPRNYKWVCPHPTEPDVVMGTVHL